MPDVSTDPESGLMHVSWGRTRPDEIVLDSDLFDALVAVVNVERRLNFEIVAAARAVCSRWEADEVDDGAMTAEIRKLRQTIEEQTEEEHR